MIMHRLVQCSTGNETDSSVYSGGGGLLNWQRNKFDTYLINGMMHLQPTTKWFFLTKLRRLAKIDTIPSFARPGNQRFPAPPAPWRPQPALWCHPYQLQTNAMHSTSMVKRFTFITPTTSAKRTDCSGPQITGWRPTAIFLLAQHHPWQWSPPGLRQSSTTSQGLV